jgi:hypothetical protein
MPAKAYVPSTTRLGQGARVAPRYPGRTSSSSNGTTRSRPSNVRERSEAPMLAIVAEYPLAAIVI